LPASTVNAAEPVMVLPPFGSTIAAASSPCVVPPLSSGPVCVPAHPTLDVATITQAAHGTRKDVASFMAPPP